MHAISTLRRADRRPAPASAFALIALAVAACSLTPAGEPTAVANREPLPSCGVEEAGQAGPWNEAARACLWDAYEAGRPAEFVSTRPTVEGDPITTIYRVLADGSVEIFTDTSHDAFAGFRGWTRLACPELSNVEGGSPALDFGPGERCLVTELR